MKATRDLETDAIIHASPAREGTVLRASGRIRAVGFALLVAALVGIFWGQLQWLARYAAEASLHSHILLVPVISAYLVYLQRDRLPKALQTSFLFGAVFLIGGASVYWLALRRQGFWSEGDFLAAVAFSIVTLVIGAAFLFFGRRWVASVAFPMAFLYFFVPLPERAVHWLENVLKLGSAEAAAGLFSLAGMPLLRDGVVFQLPNITLEVAQECSGIRSSWVLFITSVVASYVLLRSPCRRAALIAVVLPLAILRNGFRILVIGLLCVNVGPHMIHSAIHENGGPLFFALSLIPLFLLLWWLRKGDVQTKSKA